MKRAPGALQAVCIIAIGLGVLGLGAALLGTVGAVAGKAIQRLAAPQGPGNSPIEQSVEKMQQDTQAITDKWAPVTYSLLAVQFVLSICLIVGGIQALRLKPSGHRLLLIACAMVIVFELVRLFPTISMQIAMTDVMERYMADVMKSAGGAAPPPGFNRIMQSSMKAGMVFGFVFMGVWLLLKLGFYGFGIYYLRRPHVAAVYGPAEELDDWVDDES